MNTGCRALLVRGLLVITVTLPLCLLSLGIVVATRNFRGSCEVELSLSPEDAEKVSELGYNPNVVAAAASASDWCSGRFGRDVDIGILMAIYLAETVNGTTFGGCNGLEAAANFSSTNVSAARDLLGRFADYELRRVSPASTEYIGPGYRNYIGHCRAGEMGPGFLPLTGKAICEKYFANDPDPDIASCNFWNPKMFMRAIGAVITASPYEYESSISIGEKVDALYGWNQRLDYRIDLVLTAQAINDNIGSVTPVVQEGSSRPTEIAFGRGPLHDLAVLAYVTILEPLNLIPRPESTLDAPLPEGYPRVITSDYLDLRETESGNTLVHWGVDWDCDIGNPIIALASGEVISPSPGTLMSRISVFGKHVWIKHGNTYVVYAHLSFASVREGDKVSQGQVIGRCGNTGNVYPAPTLTNPFAGSHIHIGVSNKHPDEFTLYGEERPGWMNPHEWLGQCIGGS